VDIGKCADASNENFEFLHWSTVKSVMTQTWQKKNPIHMDMDAQPASDICIDGIIC